MFITQSGVEAAPATGSTASWFKLSGNDLESRLRLFCFPYAGGGASIFRNWSRQLGPQIAVTPALLPGREVKLHQRSYTRLEAVIEQLAGDIIPYLDRPFALFGHSMGALIAFELTRRVRAEHGVEPDHLFIREGAHHIFRPTIEAVMNCPSLSFSLCSSA
jgi:surfactin synthase thioesterase subunit